MTKTKIELLINAHFYKDLSRDMKTAMTNKTNTLIKCNPSLYLEYE